MAAATSTFPNSRGPLLLRCARTVAGPDFRLGRVQVHEVFVDEASLTRRHHRKRPPDAPVYRLGEDYAASLWSSLRRMPWMFQGRSSATRLTG